MKNTEIRYYVIGGQYAAYCYGGAATLHAAKLLATRSAEYWDNWQGWRTPAIYRAEDCEPCTNFYGDQIAPRPGAVPVAHKSGEKWIVNE